MDFKVIKKPTKNQSERFTTPSMIVNHISEGTAESCISWFNDATNTSSSTHFLVAKDGKIYQFVPIEKKAWGNGLTVDACKLSLLKPVRDKQINPNDYSVSIEHEGVFKDTRGALTALQLESSIKLHCHIFNEINRLYGVKLKVDHETITGHCFINPKSKPNCPGVLFPYDKIKEGVRKMLNNGEEWKVDIIKKGFENGVLTDLAGWVTKVNEPMPTWAVVAMMNNVLAKLKGG